MVERQEDLKDLSVDGYPVQNVDHFKCLRNIISNDGTTDRDVTSRIQKASSSFGRFREKVFLNRDLKVSAQGSAYEAVCVSTLLYGCETMDSIRKT